MIKGFETKTVMYAGLAFALAACSSGDSTPPLGPETQPTQQQQSAITSMQDSLTSLSTVQINSADAASAAFEFVFSSDGLFLNDAASALAPMHSAASVLAGNHAMPRVKPHDACETDAANSVTYDNCVEDGSTLNGSISWTASSVTMNLHIVDTSSADQTLDYTLAGSMTVSATAIKGDITLNLSLSGSQASGSGKIHSSVDVQLASNCITSGTLTVTETANATSGSQHESINEAVQIVWTACNMAVVRNSK